MKKIVALALPLLVLSLLSGCENKRFFINTKLSLDQVFSVDETGAFNENGLIIRDDLLRAFVIPPAAENIEFKIEGMSVRAVVKTENQAPLLKVSALVYDFTQEQLGVFVDQPIPLAGVDVPFIGLNALIEEGVGKLRNKINGYLKDFDNTPLFFVLSGDSQPSGQRIKVDIHVKITGNLKYEICRSTGKFMEGGLDCEDLGVVR